MTLNFGSGSRGLWRAALVIFLFVFLLPSGAQADAVDEAFRAGNAAAEEDDWAAAAERYEEAGRLLGRPHSLLSYNLGTARAHLGQLGAATLHLRRALEFEGNPSTELVDATRRNLATVRSWAEVEAIAAERQVDRPDGWWDLTVDALRAPMLAWLSVLAGWVALAAIGLRRRRRGSERRLVTWVLAISAGSYGALGGLYGIAVQAERTAPRAVILDGASELRDGPGIHREVLFTAQPGSSARVQQRVPGWVQARLTGGLEGWLPEAQIAEIRSP